MTLHRRPDETFAVDPDDTLETYEYLDVAEDVFCRDLCERCGLKHPEPAARCPTVNAALLRVPA